MLSHLRSKALILVIFSALASSCSSSQGTPRLNGNDNQVGSISQGSPYPFTTAEEGFVSTKDIEIDIPDPSPGFGVVTGRLLRLSADSEPYIADLYLGVAIPADQSEFDPIISFSQESDPKAIQNLISGEFLFTNISPGTYALVIWTPIGSNIIQEPGSDKFLLIEVMDGELLDLGTIEIP